MKVFARILALTLVTFSGCASLHSGHEDKICKEIAEFANATVPKTEHFVLLQNSWGSGLNNNPKLLYEVQCDHEGYAPGKQLCSYLTNNTSREFHSRNISRALRCISGAPDPSPNALTSIASLHGKVSSWSTRYVRGDVLVTFEFSTGGEGVDPFLKINASRPDDL